ncbi:hypothetical protein DUNSADRAFT_17269, partial [Dunaliella salina]
GVLPSLEFVIEPGTIMVLNNEVGFSESNLRALCDVGRSTKSAALGYIGQKGIGWKSVFRITETPSVHSRGFHVEFDLRTHKDLGYILPTWKPSSPGSSSEINGALVGDTAAPRATTHIVLPLRAEMRARGAGGGGLAARFDDLQPLLLLFLQRLQRIAVTHVAQGVQHVMSKHMHAHSVVELRRTRKLLPQEKKGAPTNSSHQVIQTSEHWLVSRMRVRPTLPRLNVVVPETEICLAFLLEDSARERGPGTKQGQLKGSPAQGADKHTVQSGWLEDGAQMMRPRPQPVFAFLPLRSYGLRFVLQ